PQYMAPEQFRGASDADHRSDLFSLGCVLYQMLTGQRPFDHPDVMMVYKRMMTGEMNPLPASTPAALVGIVADLLDPDPVMRPPSADALLERFLEDDDLRRLLSPNLANLGTDPDIVYDPNATVPPHPPRDRSHQPSPPRTARTTRNAVNSGAVARTTRRSGPPSLPPPPTKRQGLAPNELSLGSYPPDGIGGTPVPHLARYEGPPSVPPGPNSVYHTDVGGFADDNTSFYDRLSHTIEENWSWVLLGLTSLATAIVAVLIAIVYLSVYAR
ncbi:MAG: protein kinase, partial [Myxococcota bacterium]